jgi:hypothetical protein
MENTKNLRHNIHQLNMVLIVDIMGMNIQGVDLKDL